MYDITPLFWYRPLFMTELLAAEFIFFLKLRRRTAFARRTALAVALCYAVAFAFPVAFYNAAYCSFMFICLFLVTVAAGKIVFDEPLSNLLFCGIAAYAVQHIAYEVNDLLVVTLGLNGGAPLNSYGSTGDAGADGIFPFIRFLSDGYILQLFLYVFFRYVVYVFVYVAAYYAAWELFASGMDKYDVLQLKAKSIIALLLVIVTVAIVSSSIVTYSPTSEAVVTTERIMMYVYNIICCVLALYIQFELPRRKKLKRELDAVSELRYREREQYGIAKENIELINMKCHDMRHQIRTITGRAEISESAASEIDRLITIYDSAVRTGNKTIDTVITEKSLVCGKNKIRFDCIADGKALDFMEESDLYSLFGNLIENAIEAVSKLDDDSRVIDMNIRRRGGLISVTVSNPYSGGVVTDPDGTITTTKENRKYHGYGLKSVFSVCEKYGGEASVSADNGIFTVNIVFPSVPVGG